MAFVKSVEKDEHDIRGLHPTQLVLRYLTAEKDGKRILQLNSYGSDDRNVPGKLSQTLQFDAHSAKQLHDVLKREFGF